jgi:hypothetical protein
MGEGVRRYSPPPPPPLQAPGQIFKDDVNGCSSTLDISFMLSANQRILFCFLLSWPENPDVLDRKELLAEVILLLSKES